MGPASRFFAGIGITIAGVVMLLFEKTKSASWFLLGAGIGLISSS